MKSLIFSQLVGKIKGNLFDFTTKNFGTCLHVHDFFIFHFMISQVSKFSYSYKGQQHCLIRLHGETGQNANWMDEIGFSCPKLSPHSLSVNWLDTLVSKNILC